MAVVGDGVEWGDGTAEAGATGAFAAPAAGAASAGGAASGSPALSAPRTAEPLADGDMLGRYQIRRLLGEGGMGRVYLGRDTALGRSVALKVVRSVAAGTAQAARILREARVVASLNHPHIVQLYDVGEHAGSLYLALEYVDGDTLPTRTAEAPPSLDEGLRHARAIADALVHAHKHGVFHCDLKPSNVMVGRDGRLRVVDFGIAHTAEIVDHQVAGTPEWMAPEQWDGKPPTDRVDIWALGILCLELLTGRPLRGSLLSRTTVSRVTLGAPGPREVLASSLDPAFSLQAQIADCGIPQPVVELIARSLQINPRERPSAAEWLYALDEVTAGRGDALDEEGPFRGLSSFDEPNARFFFGREADVDAFLERLRNEPCLPIIGPSGVGKSSFLHAGVVPRLRSRERWTVLAFRPGAEPIAALARQVLSASDVALSEPALRREIAALERELYETPTLLAARLATLAACGHKILVCIDQLEEVFTQGASEQVRQRFLEMILTAADDARDPVRVAFTMRDDFLGRIPELRSLFVLRRMSMDELRRTIVGPLQRTGYRFDDPGIVDEMLAEVSRGEVADLPLVQFACRALWDGRDVETRLLRRATYTALGGISGALGRHAEAALTQLSSAEARSARQLLLPLVHGTTRRSIPRDQLLALAPQSEAVLDRLLAARLLVQHAAERSDQPVVEIAHESLLSSWPQLVRWLEESRDERRLLAELMDVVELWKRQGRRVVEAWSVGDLAAARSRAAQLDLKLPPVVEEFFAAVEQRHRQARRRRVSSVAVGSALIGVAGVVAFLWLSDVRKREDMAMANFGQVELSLQLFDFSFNYDSFPVDMAEYQELRWRLYLPSPDDEHQLGEPLSEHLFQTLSSKVEGSTRTDVVQAPGGMLFLSVEGRGKKGERCAPSLIRLRAWPNYATSAQGKPTRMNIAVPTCAASRRDMVEVPAGPFIYGGPGQRSTAFYLSDSSYRVTERHLDLKAYWIDRTEVSNAAFESFAKMETVTGYPRPLYPIVDEPVHVRSNSPEWPVTEVDAIEADAFCRFLGKELVSEQQWVKAARGGLTIDGMVNPYPRRLFPWGDRDRRECLNISGAGDESSWTDRVVNYDCGKSPYGVLNLVGNVDEWMQWDPTDNNPLRVVRGGSAESPEERDQHTTIYRNRRDPRFRNYSIGLRCAVFADDESKSAEEAGSNHSSRQVSQESGIQSSHQAR